jgi:hypothetical protein
MTSERRPILSALYDDLLAWLSPGGLLLTALALRFPSALLALRAQAPELILPTWLAGAYVLGLALSPLGRLVYTCAQALVWSHLRSSWAPAIAFLGARLERSDGLTLPDAATMSANVFHDVDRRLREYLEAVDPGSRPTLNRMKVFCSLSCNATAGCLVFVVMDVAAGNAPTWTARQIVFGILATVLALVASIYRERRRQRTQLSIWRRRQVQAAQSWRPGYHSDADV